MSAMYETSTLKVLERLRRVEVSRGQFLLARDLSQPHRPDIFDVRLKCGDENFPAHRYVLMARSTVFQQLLEPLPQKREKRKDSDVCTLEITDLEHTVLAEMLHFIYNGFFPHQLDYQMASDLLSAAAKYGVSSLKTAIEGGLMDMTTLENILDHLVLAHEHDAETLKLFCLHYVRLHRVDVLSLPRAGPVREDNPQLLQQIFEETKT